MVKSSLGGEVYALSEMAYRFLLLMDFRGRESGSGGTGILRESLCPPRDREDDRRGVPGTPFFGRPAGLGGR